MIDLLALAVVIPYGLFCLYFIGLLARDWIRSGD